MLVRDVRADRDVHGHGDPRGGGGEQRSEEHTSELQSQSNLVCRLLLEKKKKNSIRSHISGRIILVMQNHHISVVRPHLRTQRRLLRARISSRVTSRRPRSRTALVALY